MGAVVKSVKSQESFIHNCAASLELSYLLNTFGDVILEKKTCQGAPQVTGLTYAFSYKWTISHKQDDETFEFFWVL